MLDGRWAFETNTPGLHCKRYDKDARNVILPFQQGHHFLVSWIQQYGVHMTDVFPNLSKQSSFYSTPCLCDD